MLFTSRSRSVFGKTVPCVLSTARGLLLLSRAQFFPIRTSRLANNIFIFFREQDIFTARITIIFFFSHMKTTIVMATGSLIKMVVFFFPRGVSFSSFFLQTLFWLRSAYSWRKKFCFWSSDLRTFPLNRFNFFEKGSLGVLKAPFPLAGD